MVLSRRLAFLLGAGALAAVLMIQALNSFACYGHSFATYLQTLLLFVAAPLLPALVSLVFFNPLRAVGACALFAPWLLYAFYADCLTQIPQGGPSITYVGVLFWGLPSAIAGALATEPILNWLRIRVQ